MRTEPGQPEAPQPVAALGADATALLAQLTQAVRKYGAEKQRVPASLNEVVSAGYVRAMPQPPPGKKFAINPKRMEVILVNN